MSSAAEEAATMVAAVRHDLALRLELAGQPGCARAAGLRAARQRMVALVYAWPYEDRDAWTTTRARSVRSVLSRLTSA